MLPFKVQRLVLDRIRALQKMRVNGSPGEKARFSKEAVIKRIKAQQKKTDSQLARAQFKYSRTGCLIDKVQGGTRLFETEEEYYNSLVKVLHRDMDDLPKNSRDPKGTFPAEKMTMKRQQMVKPAQDCGCTMNCTTNE